jgi:hypothetical protein
MKLFLLSLSLLLAACIPGSQERPSASVSDSLIHSVSDTRSYLLHQIDLLDSVREAGDYDDALDSINNNIYRGLEKLAKNDAYQMATFSQDEAISYLLSEDKKLCVVSWDTRTGGTMIIDATVAIYQTSAGTNVQYFGDDPNTEEIENSLGHFTELYGLTADSVTTYFAYGSGKGSTRLLWRVLQAFRISADTLDLTQPTFDDRDNSIFYDLSKFASPNDVEEITFSTDHRQIQVPEVEDEAPTGRYNKYNFSNGIYRRVK